MNNITLFKYFIPILTSLWIFWWMFGSKWHFIANCLVAFPLMVIAWTLAYALYDHLNIEKVDSKGKTVLVTGCDTGFGNQLAKKLDALGYHVYAGLLFPDGEGAKKLKSDCSPRLKIRRMDVTSAEEVEKVVKEISDSDAHLWAVVNNAGIALGAPFDWGKDVEPFQRTFDVNILGVIRVTKNCLPLLRKSNGRIVNVASVAGRITAPLISHYCMAKHSVRVFSDALRRELYSTNISVVNIEPTFYRTSIIDFERIKRSRDRLFEETPENIRESYSKECIQMIDESEKLVQTITREDVGEVIQTLEKAVTLVHPKLFYRCGGYGDVIIWIAGLLPETILDALVHTFSMNRYTIQLAKVYLNMFGKQKSKSN